MADMKTLSDGVNTYNVVDAGAARKTDVDNSIDILNNKVNSKLDKNQGSTNANKYLKIDTHGNVVPANIPTGGGTSGGTVTQQDIQNAVNDYMTRNPISVPTKLSELTSDTTHRTVTDAEKQQWNNKSNLTETRVNELIEAKLPRNAEGVLY